MTWLEWTAIAVALLICYALAYARGRAQGLTEFRASMEHIAENMDSGTKELREVVAMFKEAAKIIRGEADG